MATLHRVNLIIAQRFFQFKSENIVQLCMPARLARPASFELATLRSSDACSTSELQADVVDGNVRVARAVHAVPLSYSPVVGEIGVEPITLHMC